MMIVCEQHEDCMVTLAVLSNVSPSPLSLELEKWGYTVYEAVNLTDFAGLCDYLKPAAVVVRCGVDANAVADLAQRHIVIEQPEGCTAEQIVSTLRLMFGHLSPKQ
jgi:hypothetical protein